jgi:hypothetical protein
MIARVIQLHHSPGGRGRRGGSPKARRRAGEGESRHPHPAPWRSPASPIEGEANMGNAAEQGMGRAAHVTCG